MGDPRCYRFVIAKASLSGHAALYSQAVYPSSLPYPATERDKEGLIDEIARTRIHERVDHYVHLISTLPEGAAARHLVETYKVCFDPAIVAVRNQSL